MVNKGATFLGFSKFSKGKSVLELCIIVTAVVKFLRKRVNVVIFLSCFYLFQITKPSATSFENLVGFFQKFLNVSSFNNDQQKNKFDFDLQYHEWRSQLQNVHLDYSVVSIKRTGCNKWTGWSKFFFSTWKKEQGGAKFFFSTWKKSTVWEKTSK